MQYPNLVHGALAASAPMFWVSAMRDSHDFWVKVTTDFNAYDGCEDKIRAGFCALNAMAENANWTDAVFRRELLYTIWHINYIFQMRFYYQKSYT